MGRQIASLMACTLAYASLTTSCKARRTSSSSQSEIASLGTPFGQEGVKLRTLPKDPPQGTPSKPILDAKGQELDEALVYDPNQDQVLPERQVNGLALGEGYKRFVWPKAEEVRTFEGLKRNVEAYATLVGTCLKRPTEGPGELDFCRSRNGRWESVRATRQESFEAGCRQIVLEFIDTSYEGSKYCQYGNCREGGELFMCMAAHGGHPRERIFNCQSTKDHNFSLVWRGGGQDYCMMDRWSIGGRGYFYCNVSVTDGVVEVNGEKAKDDWFQDVTCTPASDIKAFGK